MNKKKLSLLLLMFILIGITSSKTSWGQFGSAITVTHAPYVSAPSNVTFIACTSSQCAAPHVFPPSPQSSYTFPQLSSPYQTFEISTHYTKPNPPFNTLYYNFVVNKADVDAANGSQGLYYDSNGNGAILLIWKTGINQYSFDIQLPVGI